MKSLLIITCLLALAFTTQAQTSAELLGKWQLVKWTNKGREKDIVKEFKTDEVYQIFKEGGEFQSIIGEKVKDGKWSLTKENTVLKIKNGLISVKFKIKHFDSQKRIVSSTLLGEMEYAKVEN